MIVKRPWLLLSCALVAAAAGSARVSAEPLASLQSVLTAPADANDPLFRLYRWNRFPSILILDTIDYRFQDRMFSRLAFFLEKRGFRGRLLDNVALEKMHGWNAHDYGSAGLASFFNAAARVGFILNPEEITLKDLALEEGVLMLVHDRYAPGEGGVISISRASSAIERRLLLAHESFHGIFFASPEYRAFCFQLWDSLDPKTHAFFRRFLDELGYDADYHYLEVNEFQAYLMQQPATYAPEYFGRVMKRFGGGHPVPEGDILNAARRLARFLESRFGIPAGGAFEAHGSLREAG